MKELKVTSSAFEHEGNIPSKYSCEGFEINPPLHIGDIPEDAKSLAIIVEDPDAANGTYDHWLMWNIPPSRKIEENSLPGISGANSAGKTGFHAPCPPSGSHRYYFHVFALAEELDLLVGDERNTLETAMKPHILAKGTLMGRYEKSKTA